MISDIFKKYNAVDTVQGTDKITSHSYDYIYNELFLKYKDSCSKFLEIGFSGGFGLQSYSEYFKNATIYGIDIKDDRDSNIKHNSNIKVYIGDAKSEETINHFQHEFDIILEDASHLPEDQIQHFRDYSKFVKSGGVYIIEDVHQDNIDVVFNETNFIAIENNFKSRVVDLRHIKNRFDDIIIIFEKQ
jgi:selenocysteine-specific translation elongation factor